MTDIYFIYFKEHYAVTKEFYMGAKHSWKK